VGVATPIYIRYLDDSKITATRASVENLSKTVELFYTKFDRYPQNLQELLTPPDGGLPLVKQKDLKDSWGRDFRYTYPGTQNQAYGLPDIWSEGPLNHNAPIGNWQSAKGN